MNARRNSWWVAIAAVAVPPVISGVSSADATKAKASAPSASAAPSASTSAAPTTSASAVPIASAPLPATLDAEILVLHATNNGGGIDPRVGDMPQLKKPPFSAYNSYKLLEKSRVSLGGGRIATSTLPNESKLELALREVVTKGRFKVITSIHTAKGRVVLPRLETVSSAGETFFVAGQGHQGGVLVVGIRLLG